MSKPPYEAFKRVRTYCLRKRKGCMGCPLNIANEIGCSKCRKAPAYWNIRKEKKND